MKSLFWLLLVAPLEQRGVGKWDPIITRLFFSVLWSQNCLEKGHVLWANMPYARACLIGVHVLWEDITFYSICHSGVHVFQIDMSDRSICFKESHA